MEQRRSSSTSPVTGRREVLVKSASACAGRQQHGEEGVHRRAPHAHQEGDDVIKPKKLANPVKASKSHQELHRELLNKRCGQSVQVKPELQQVLESRRREQRLRQRKQEDDAHRKMSPLEAELLRRHRKLEELETQPDALQEDVGAPEFIRVKENLRRTSKEV